MYEITTQAGATINRQASSLEPRATEDAPIPAD
jgi:hypothetical protein